MLMYLKKIIFVIFATLASALCVALLLSCGSIPVMVPDMALRPSHPVQFDGAHGPLSTQQSKAVLARLKRNGADTNIFDKHLALEAEIVGSPLLVGNKVDLLVDGPSTYKSMFSAMQKAKNHINMETYIFDDDEIGQRFAELLISKQRSGCKA